MVKHQILLGKLNHYGIKGPVLKWLESYLSNRKQFMSLNGSDSATSTMDYGVTQGSILGPILFIIYINDIVNIAEFTKFISYADDANISLTGKTIEAINNQLENLVSNLKQWVSCNPLQLNLKKKLNIIFFRTQNTELPQPLFISGTPSNAYTNQKFLE